MDKDSIHVNKKRVPVGGDASDSISRQSPPGPMKILVWNCQGMGPPWTVRTLTELIRLHRPGLIFVSETKCKAMRCDRVKDAVNYFRVGVDLIGKGGGLLLLWRKDIDVWLQSLSAHHIDVTISSEGCSDR
ncbi:UNVERIFIED_CONTAM: hypothetical protein Slati_2191700 [Sesamum latifolium]|uniref:Uncharacterized protein n=1 Tax=Sesamum latifolium TaxID=2727402 RepID=A0AAW2WX70_9LAMI